MASSFMGLYVQREALIAAQKALDITGNNISNIKTEGYSRQRVDVCSVGNIGYNLFYNTSVSLAGQGVDTVGVAQYRDALIDQKVRTYTTTYNDRLVKDTVMSDVETALDNIEADDTGFAANLAKFKTAIQSFSSDNADRQEIANVTIQAAKSVAEQMRYMNSRLDDISTQALSDAKSCVTKVNTILESMGNLNEQITNSYISMGYIDSTSGNYQVDNDYGPLELKDSMNLLIDQLSEYGSVEVEERYNGSYQVTFEGKLVVFNNQYAQLAMTNSDPDGDPDNPEPLNMGFTISGAGNLTADGEHYTGLMDSDHWYKIKTNPEMAVDDNGNSVDPIANYVRNQSSYPVELSSKANKVALDFGNNTAGKAYTVDVTLDGVTKQISFIADADEDITKNMFLAELNTEFPDPGFKFNDDSSDLVLVDDGTKHSFSVAANEEAVGLTADASNKDNATEIVKSIDLTEKNASGEYRLSEGKLRAYFDVYNGAGVYADSDGNVYQGIEYYRGMLNSFAKTMTEEFNAIFNPDGTTGFNIFTYADSDGNNDFWSAAENFKVSDEWIANPSLVAHPEQWTNDSVDDYTELDNTYINKMLGAFNTAFKYGYTNAENKDCSDPLSYTLENFVGHISDNLGTQIESNKKILDTTEIMLDSVQDARDEVMCVSMDEEGINMMNYQKWYNAIARMVTTLDEALDKVINGMGVVGL